MSKTDAELLAAAKTEYSTPVCSGFEEILLRYEKLIYHIARRYFHSPEDAEDAAQEAVIRIYKGIPKVEIPESGTLKSWLCTVTANTCLDSLRKKRVVTAPMPEDDISSGVVDSAEETAVANAHIQEVLAALGKLPEDHRMALVLREMQGLSYEELAEVLSINIGTVKSRISRARAGLKKLLE